LLRRRRSIIECAVLRVGFDLVLLLAALVLGMGVAVLLLGSMRIILREREAGSVPGGAGGGAARFRAEVVDVGSAAEGREKLLGEVEVSAGVSGVGGGEASVVCFVEGRRGIVDIILFFFFFFFFFFFLFFFSFFPDFYSVSA
jgi:hypothetical protein